MYCHLVAACSNAAMSSCPSQQRTVRTRQMDCQGDDIERYVRYVTISRQTRCISYRSQGVELPSTSTWKLFCCLLALLHQLEHKIDQRPKQWLHGVSHSNYGSACHFKSGVNDPIVPRLFAELFFSQKCPTTKNT